MNTERPGQNGGKIIDDSFKSNFVNNWFSFDTFFSSLFFGM